MENKIEIRSVNKNDLSAISEVLLDWLTAEEVEHYIKQIHDIISDTSGPKFDSHYYVAVLDKVVIGLVGFREPLPKLLKFTTKAKPAELCMIYVSNKHRGGQGVGTALLNYVIKELVARKYDELVVRSAEKFSDTGWGFYDSLGFERVGQLLPPESETKSQVWLKQL